MSVQSLRNLLNAFSKFGSESKVFASQTTHAKIESEANGSRKKSFEKRLTKKKKVKKHKT